MEPVFPLSEELSRDYILERIRSGAPPETAEEYLLRVRYEAEEIPDIVTAIISEEYDDMNDTTSNSYVPKVEPVESCDKSLLPSDQWEREILSAFVDIRQYLMYWASEGVGSKEAGQRIEVPALKDDLGWHIFCLGCRESFLESDTKENESYREEISEMESFSNFKNSGCKVDKIVDAFENLNLSENSILNEDISFKEEYVETEECTLKEEDSSTENLVLNNERVLKEDNVLNKEYFVEHKNWLNKDNIVEVNNVLEEKEEYSLEDNNWLNKDNVLEVGNVLEENKEYFLPESRLNEGSTPEVKNAQEENELLRKFDCSPCALFDNERHTLNEELWIDDDKSIEASLNEHSDSEAEESDKKMSGLEWSERCPVGTSPTTALLLQFDQVLVQKVLAHHAHWLKSMHISNARAAWIYALLARLEKPLSHESAALIRELLRRCCSQRSKIYDQRHPSLAPLNVLISICGRFYAQAEKSELE